MSSLKRIQIKGFRSIKGMTLELRPLNVLIGANGAGKSNLIAFFKLVNELMAGRLTCMPCMRISLALKKPKSCAWTPTGGWTRSATCRSARTARRCSSS